MPYWLLNFVDIWTSGGITHRQTFQRTRLTRLNSDNEESELVRKVSSSLIVQNEFLRSDSQDLLPDRLDTSFDRKICGYLMCNAMSQHGRNCCYYHRYPFPCWVHYIKPVVQVSLVIMCGFGMFSVYQLQKKSFDKLSLNIHGIKMDIEAFAVSKTISLFIRRKL